MSYPTILEKYRSNLLINFDSRDGDIRERVQNVAPTVNGAPIWGKNVAGFGVAGNATGYLEWAANAAYDVTSAATLVCQFIPNSVLPSSTGQVLVSRATLSPNIRNGFVLSASAGQPGIGLASATGVNSITIGSAITRPDEEYTVATTWDATGTVHTFVNGKYSSITTYTNTPSPSGQVLRIAGYSAYGFTKWPVQRVLLFNTALTEQEVAQLYEEMKYKCSVLNSRFRSTTPPVLSGSALTMLPKMGWERVIPNLANPTNNGTMSGSIDIFSDGFTGIRFPGNSHITFGDLTTLNSASNVTLECAFMQRTANASGAGLISKTSNSTTLFGLELNASTSFGINATVKNGADTYASVASVGYNNYPMHVMSVYNGNGATNADKLKIYVNGVLQTSSYVGTIPTAPPSLSGTSVLVGNTQIATANKNFNGYIFRANAYSRSFTDAEVKSSYIDWARNAYFRIPAEGRWLLGAKAGTGNIFDDSGWITETAIACSELLVSGTRVFKNAASSFVITRLPMDLSIGTWEWAMSSAGTGVGIDFVRTVYARTANTGYSISLSATHQPLITRLNGATLLTGTAVSANTLYKFRVTRRANGRIDLWYKPVTGDRTTWVYVGNVTDTTTTARNQFMSLIIGVNCLISREFVVYPGIFAPGDVPSID